MGCDSFWYIDNLLIRIIFRMHCLFLMVAYCLKVETVKSFDQCGMDSHLIESCKGVSKCLCLKFV